MRKRVRKPIKDLGALSEVQLNDEIKIVRTLMRLTDAEIERLNKHSKKGTKILSLNNKRFIARRETLRNRRRKLEKELQKFQEAKATLRTQKQS